MPHGKLLHYTKVAFTMDDDYSTFTGPLNTVMHYLGGVQSLWVSTVFQQRNVHLQRYGAHGRNAISARSNCLQMTIGTESMLFKGIVSKTLQSECILCISRLMIQS